MKKAFFFSLTAVVVLVAGASAEAPDKKPALDKKEQAMQLVLKGNTSFAARRFDEAITYYKSALDLDPASIDAHYDLGVTYGEKGMLDESIAAYTRVIALDPRHAQAHNNLGTAYEQKGMAQEAHAEYEKAVTADPNLAPALYNLGKSYWSKGSNALAAEHLHKAGELFLRMRNKEWAMKSYNILKLTNSKELEKDLHQKINPETKEQKKEKPAM